MGFVGGPARHITPSSGSLAPPDPYVLYQRVLTGRDNTLMESIAKLVASPCMVEDDSVAQLGLPLEAWSCPSARDST